ncbi:heavy metal translocating P-type ATPase [Carnobacterium divergens]|uniref:Cd(2+)-exporting ATPase n=1 Tax=Carnobacterium divergens TaxID=2748 RepID=A0A7Z8CZW0_CARDV|nr:heavy metal translocating P-type ATPase [Carnobacterium divergens]MPQ23335.1 cadmium-translocating P-type ATPase [Carnobacterium divergens]TFI74197.1 cadmium-translocating P-type ATPase [Carnobacterium divergens]TFI78519.1 cadmium-translocating P-type ATPase [Carnobacterium divergens]TFI85078.1 cadmium-translocating P-type ATPase [Carnobacterium divergens]TFI97434.1 cadmium-translocating P-type ATPase [Carnobacterium divergens]
MRNDKKLYLVLSVGIIALILEFLFQQNNLAQGLITIAGVVMSGVMVVGMVKTLRSGSYGVDILAITAIIATLAVGEYWASLIILIMLTGGDSLEDYAAKKARSELKSLLDNSPQIAHKYEGDQLVELPVENVKVKDVLVVKPGEVVPVDGTVLSGQSLFDEASLTGESKPVNKQAGDLLMSGSINGDGAITMTVDKVAADSQFQHIVRLVKESEQQPAHFVRLADRYAVPFTIVAYLIAGIAWYISKDPKRFAEVLVVASPCPLILAAPIAMVSGMSRSSRNGIIIKTGTTIEKLATAKSIAFDKTGTLTNGVLSVDQIRSTGTIANDKMVLLAASAEQQSGHILAKSLMTYVGNQNLLKASGIEESVGNGVTAEVEGQEIKVGKLTFVAPNQTPEGIKQTALFISVNNQYAGFITFTDTIRSEAKETISQLKAEGLTKLMMLTGDQKDVAVTIAKEVGITEVKAECLPGDKISALKEIPDSERPIIMVGDGVNDAPSLTIADIGIAMGAHGSTAASESADVVVLKDDLSKVSTVIQLSKDTMKIAKESVLLGILICTILMLVASTGVIPALLGAALQEVVDVVSIFSALRARKDRKRKRIN